jgi:hypothetical protein
LEHLKKMGVVLKRAKYFIYNNEVPRELHKLYPEMIRPLLIAGKPKSDQLDLFDTMPAALPSPATNQPITQPTANYQPIAMPPPRAAQSPPTLTIASN